MSIKQQYLAMPQSSWPWHVSGQIHDKGQGHEHTACNSPGVTSVGTENMFYIVNRTTRMRDSEDELQTFASTASC